MYMNLIVIGRSVAFVTAGRSGTAYDVASSDLCRLSVSPHHMRSGRADLAEMRAVLMGIHWALISVPLIRVICVSVSAPQWRDISWRLISLYTLRGDIIINLSICVMLITRTPPLSPTAGFRRHLPAARHQRRHAIIIICRTAAWHRAWPGRLPGLAPGSG